MRTDRWFEMTSKLALGKDLCSELVRSRNRLLRASLCLSREGTEIVSRISSTEQSRELATLLADHMTVVVAIHSMVLAHHESVRILSSVGHGLEATANLRAQLEAALTLMYLTFPSRDIQEVRLRCDSYLDWVMVKMHMNMEKSRKFALYDKLIRGGSYGETVEDNYQMTCRKYADNEKELRRLKRSPSFVPNKRDVANAAGIGDLYAHIYAEASATIHLVDASDRSLMATDGRHARKLFRIRNRNAAFWPMFCSVMLQVAELRALAEFLGLEETLRLRTLDLGLGVGNSLRAHTARGRDQRS